MAEYQVIARKWRPQRFADVVGQQHVVRTLKNAISQDRIAHAYLFVGPRGIGKTTLARIFAKAVNCEHPRDGEPCCECASCLSVADDNSLDVIEIDAASHNSAAEMRDLAQEVLHAPVASKYKIYIIDEVHMLSKSAWNALLKTVEEDYAQHIENKAVLSYRNNRTAEEVARAILSEIIEKQNLLWLKSLIEEKMQELTQAEQLLIAIRYFGKEKKIKRPLLRETYGAWSERKYFRDQARIGDRFGRLLRLAGLTKEIFERDFAELSFFKKIYSFVCAGKDRAITQSERRWLGTVVKVGGGKKAKTFS